MNMPKVSRRPTGCQGAHPGGGGGGGGDIKLMLLWGRKLCVSEIVMLGTKIVCVRNCDVCPKL